MRRPIDQNPRREARPGNVQSARMAARNRSKTRIIGVAGPPLAWWVLTWVACAAAHGQTISNTPRPEMWVTNGNVYAMAQSCGQLYIGGDFTYVGPLTGSFTGIDVTSAQPNPGLPNTNGWVLAMAPDGVGGWYIGGSFTFVGGLPRQKLAHIKADQSVDPSWNPGADNNIRAIDVANNTVYVGGEFTVLGGAARGRIAAVSAITGQLTPWNPIANETVLSMSIVGGAIYVGGGFTIIGGLNRNHIAQIDLTTAQATSWNPNANSNVYALKAASGTVYAGGDFSTVGGITRNFISAIDASTGQVTPWNPSANGSVRAFAVSGGTVYTSGFFTSIGSQSRNRIAALDAMTGQATPWNPDSNSWVHSLAVSNDLLYAGGDFTLIAGQPRNRLAAFDITTGQVIGWNPNANSWIYALSVEGNTVYVGGDFISVGGQPRNRIAAINLATGRATDWNPNANSTVNALAVSGNTIYAGGSFTSIGGANRNRIAALDANSGFAVPTWDPNANGTVNTLTVSGATVYAGGSFSGPNSIGGANRDFISALNTTNGLAIPSWEPNANGPVLTLAISSGTVYAGGSFSSIGGQSRYRLAALDATTGVATPWYPLEGGPTWYWIQAVAVSGNTVYVGGGFDFIGGELRNGIAALDATSGAATAWDPNANGPIRALTVSGNAVYAAGEFSSIGGQTRNRIAALDTTSGAATTWNPNANSTVNTLNVSGTAVYAGGSFASVGGQPRQGLAAFSVTNSGWAGAAGFWSVASNWSPPVVPDNSSCDQFNVEISGATADVTLDINPSINSLKLESGSTVGITAGNLKIVTSEGVTNDANLSIGPNQALIAGAPMTVGGTQPIQLAGLNAALSSETAVDFMTFTTDVVGQGAIDAAFIIQGRTIDANVAGQTLDIFGSLSAIGTGTLKASNGGTLLLNRSIGGTSAFVADGGSLQVPGFSATNITGATLDVFSGGQAQLFGLCQMSLSSRVRLVCSPTMRGCTPPVLGVLGSSGLIIGGDLEIAAGQASFGDTSQTLVAGQVRLSCNAGLRGCTPPVLSVVGGSNFNVGGDFLPEGLVEISVNAGTTFNLAGDFNNQTTDPFAFHWEQGPLTFNGAVPQTFELAGRDLGSNEPNGFIDNFAMGTLRIEPGRTVSFNDSFDNSPGAGCEALYVDTLILGAGSTIHLNGCNIYFRRLIKDPTAVVDGTGALESALLGDVTCDGSISGADIQALVLILTDPAAYAASYPGCDILQADLNQNKIVDWDDVDRFVCYLLGVQYPCN